MGVAQLVEEVFGKGVIEREMAESAEVAHAVMERAKEAQAYWRAYWESFPHPSSREHTLTSGYVVHPGDYSKSVRITYGTTEDGAPKATVGTRDFRAHWIEYGSSKMPERACRAATIAHFGGSDGSISS